MKLVPQTYGIATAGTPFGGPVGVWLECRKCSASARLAGASTTISDAAAAAHFRAGGWTGEGDRMLNAKCPECSNGDLEVHLALKGAGLL